MNRPTVTWEPASEPPTRSYTVLVAVQTMIGREGHRVIRVGYYTDHQWHVDSRTVSPDAEVIAWALQPTPPGGWVDEEKAS